MPQTKMLNYLMGTTSKVEIMRVLFESDDAMTGRRISNLAGISPRSCQLSLDNLVKNKALYRKAIGRAYAYTVNREHKMIWDLLRPVFEAEREIHKAATAAVQRVCKPHEAIVSVWWKLHHQRVGEDVRLIVVVDRKRTFSERELLEQLGKAMQTEFGFECAGEVVEVSEFGPKYVGSDATRKRFEREFERVKGLSLTELAGEPAKAPKKKAAKAEAEEAV